MVLNYYLKLSPALLKVITEASHSSLFQIFCGKLHAAASDLIRDLIRTLRVSLDYFNAPAFACLNKPHHHRYRTCPEHDVITYTIVCCKRQAISNPIGLNLHVFFTSNRCHPKMQNSKIFACSARGQYCQTHLLWGLCMTNVTIEF